VYKRQLTASAQNAQDNGVADRLTLVGSNTPVGEQADIVIANILASILIELADAMSSLVRPGGRIALSGILAEQAGAVMEAFSGMFEFEEPYQLDDWILIAGVRKP
jgi:ribosomal protein L11 methyltransferase